MNATVKAPEFNKESGMWQVESFDPDGGEFTGKNTYNLKTKEDADRKFQYLVARGYEIVSEVVVDDVTTAAEQNAIIVTPPTRPTAIDYLVCVRDVIAEHYEYAKDKSSNALTRSAIMHQRCHTLISMYPEIYADVARA